MFAACATGLLIDLTPVRSKDYSTTMNNMQADNSLNTRGFVVNVVLIRDVVLGTCTCT